MRIRRKKGASASVFRSRPSESRKASVHVMLAPLVQDNSWAGAALAAKTLFK